MAQLVCSVRPAPISSRWVPLVRFAAALRCRASLPRLHVLLDVLHLCSTLSDLFFICSCFSSRSRFRRVNSLSRPGSLFHLLRLVTAQWVHSPVIRGIRVLPTALRALLGPGPVLAPAAASCALLVSSICSSVNHLPMPACRARLGTIAPFLTKILWAALPVRELCAFLSNCEFLLVVTMLTGVKLCETNPRRSVQRFSGPAFQRVMRCRTQWHVVIGQRRLRDKLQWRHVSTIGCTKQHLGLPAVPDGCARHRLITATMPACAVFS